MRCALVCGCHAARWGVSHGCCMVRRHDVCCVRCVACCTSIVHVVCCMLHVARCIMHPRTACRHDVMAVHASLEKQTLDVRAHSLARTHAHVHAGAHVRPHTQRSHTHTHTLTHTRAHSHTLQHTRPHAARTRGAARAAVTFAFRASPAFFAPFAPPQPKSAPPPSVVPFANELGVFDTTPWPDARECAQRAARSKREPMVPVEHP
jgi:hypothetical protein